MSKLRVKATNMKYHAAIKVTTLQAIRATG